MSRKKRKTPPGKVQASARAVVCHPFWAPGRWYWYDARRWSWRKPLEAYGESLEACVDAIKAAGFGAYTFEGKTFRLRSRYVAGDRLPP